MDNLIKKETPIVNDTDIKKLVEYTPSKKPKLQIADKRSDGDFIGDISIQGEFIAYEQYNSRDNYPWEEEYDFDLSQEEILQIKNQHELENYQFIGETKIQVPRRSTKYKGTEGQFVEFQNIQTSQLQKASRTRRSASKNRKTYKNELSYRPDGGTGKTYNGWPLIPPSNKSELETIKIPGITSRFTVAKKTVPVFFNFIYDFHHTVEDINSLVPRKAILPPTYENMLKTRAKPGEVQGDGSYAYRRVNNRKKSNAWSCHASATAVDFNTTWHWLGYEGSFVKPGSLEQIFKLIKYYNLRWGGNFGRAAIDEMHFEIWISPDRIEGLIQEKNLINRMNLIKSGQKPSSIP